ncbi:MAG: hypothetical protein ACRDP3_13390 [Streptomyces sp.]|uniref:hypothetical protein n=1 Tax=Streptomyces sp. TaxID=1931 RepID=UPI003D6B1304
MLEEPRSGRLAAWGNALIAGLVSPDEAAGRIVGEDAVHRVAWLPAGPAAEPEAAPVGLTLALGRLRSLGAAGLRVALPAPGHPLGLSGPPEFNSRALEAGEAVLATGAAVGLVPEITAAGTEGDLHVEVTWHCLPVQEGPPSMGDTPSLGEAERELAEAVRDATEVLTELDVAGSGPVADAALDAYRARMEAGRRLLAPGYPPRAVRVLELAQRVRALVAIAYGNGAGTGAGGGNDGREHGGAVSASQIVARADALRPVERTARRAQVAAYNAYAEELERKRS